MGEESALDPVVLAARVRRAEARIAQLEDWRDSQKNRRMPFAMPYLSPGQKLTMVVVGLFAFSLCAAMMTRRPT